jgi:hypothetical protein
LVGPFGTGNVLGAIAVIKLSAFAVLTAFDASALPVKEFVAF